MTMTSYTFTAGYFNKTTAKEYQIKIIAFTEMSAIMQANSKKPEGYELVSLVHLDSKGRILRNFRV